MTNFPNMSYCMAQNTREAVQQLIDAMEEQGVELLEDMSRPERLSFELLVTMAEEFHSIAQDLLEAAEQDAL